MHPRSPSRTAGRPAEVDAAPTVAHPLAPAAVALAALACATCDSAPPHAGPATTDSADVQIVTSDPLNSDATCRASEEPVIRVGDAEGDQDQWFSTIRGLGLLSDGGVAAIDRDEREVRVFGAEGRHLQSMGREGEGPGEFRSAWYVWVLPGDTLWIGDYRPWRYNVFTRDGQFVRAVQVTPTYPNPSRVGGVLRNGISVNTRTTFIARPNFLVPDTLIVEAHDTDGQLVTTLARLPNRIWGTTTKSEAVDLELDPLFDASAAADAIGSTVAIGYTGEPEVRLLDEELRLRTIVRWTESAKNVTSADVTVWRESYVASQGGRDSDAWGPFDEAIVDPDRPVADMFPAFHSFLLGTDGRLWVAPYRRPGQEPRRWMAFEPDGTFSCHLERVPLSSIHEIGADYVLGVHADELGIESAVLYRLDGPE